MILALDHLIFGNGYGMASPFCDARYYWLVDTHHQKRSGRNGELYQYGAGFGAQLRSRQWTHPRAGERRRLAGREFVVFHSTRRWFRVEVAWSMVGLPRAIDEANAALRELERDLGRV
jgi:hypothetical protein